jgi:aryl-alcohol dehydrogenase-like predicted oxidoreductase
MVPVPPLLVGTSRLGSVLPDALARRSVQAAELGLLDALEDAGCTGFDLAQSYQVGGTERLVGRWLRARGNRDRLFLVGKGGHPYPGIRPNRLTAGALRTDLEGSLRRLGTDRLDLYLLHRDFPGAPLEPMVEVLATAHRAGKILGWGVSNWTVERIEAIQAVAASAGLPPMQASSPHFSLADWVRPPWSGSVSIAGPANRAARDFHARTGLRVLAWAPLGSGFLAGARANGTYGSPENLARRERLEALAAVRGCTPAQLALAYCWSQPFPVSVVVAASSAEKMRRNLDAASMRLSPEEVRALEGRG